MLIVLEGCKVEMVLYGYNDVKSLYERNGITAHIKDLI